MDFKVYQQTRSAADEWIACVN